MWLQFQVEFTYSGLLVLAESHAALHILPGTSYFVQNSIDQIIGQLRLISLMEGFLTTVLVHIPLLALQHRSQHKVA